MTTKEKTKQEEIREWLENELDIHKAFKYSRQETTRDILSYLDSMGVVIIKDRELPDYLMEGQIACNKPTYQEMLKRAGYVATERLIKE